METIVHSGRETAYREVRPDGDGPPVMYVHGSGGTHRIWGFQYRADGPAHPAIGLDLSGHGNSDDIDTRPGPETLDAYTEDVVAVAEATGAEVLVGHSLGGAVVLNCLLESALQPTGAVFAGTGAKLRVHEAILEMIETEFEAVVEHFHDGSQFLTNVDQETVAHSKAALEATGQAVTRRDFLTCHEFDVRDRVNEIETPSVAIVGEDDPLTPPAYHRFLADEMPRCQLVTIENAAHLLMLDQPTAFNASLRSFCNRLQP